MIKDLLAQEWIANLDGFSQLKVGYSGGLDSTVLLHLLAAKPTLRKKLSAIHIHHGISPNAAAWATHCREACDGLNIPFLEQCIEFDRTSNVEENARTARYAFFSSQLNPNHALVLGHHQNDQAETLLLQLVRGAGVDGMASMPEIGQLGLGAVVRPLLAKSRQQLEDYAIHHQLKWIEDESNQDMEYSRNFIRYRIMPLLTEKWPGVSATISRTASHCQQAKAHLEQLALLDHSEVLGKELDIAPLKSLDDERALNVVRTWLKSNQVQLPSGLTQERLIDELVRARPDACPLVAWDEVQIRRYQNRLYLDQKVRVHTSPNLDWDLFPQPLKVSEHEMFLAKEASQGIKIPPSAEVNIRFREGGESFIWRGQTKKLKKLLQEWNVAPWLRDHIPLLYVNGQLAAVIGYAISDLFFAQESTHVWEINRF